MKKILFPIDFLPYWWTSTTSHIISIPFVSKSSRWVPYPWSLTVSKITYSKVNTRLSLYLYIDDGVVLSYWIAINWSQYKVSKEVKIHRTPDCGVPSPSKMLGEHVKREMEDSKSQKTRKSDARLCFLEMTGSTSMKSQHVCLIRHEHWQSQLSCQHGWSGYLMGPDPLMKSVKQVTILGEGIILLHEWDP